MGNSQEPQDFNISVMPSSLTPVHVAKAAEGLNLYDTASHQVSHFVPLKPGEVGIYVCGATVQSSPHIGHIRAAVAFDIVRRWFLKLGYKVTFVRNVTDIDDKILVKAAAAGQRWWARAYYYEREFTAAIGGHASPTLESMLLNAADSLDIGRVTEFDFKYFPFLRGGEQEGPKALVPEYQNLRQALHEEADLLARMTDPLTQTRDLRMKLIQAGEAEDMVYVQRAASEAVAGQLALDAEEDFLAFVEGKIRAHPDMFPLLTRYYLDPLA